MTIQKRLDQLADVLEEKKMLEVKEKALREQLQKFLKEHKLEKEESERAVVAVRRTSRWVYNDNTTEALDTLKAEMEDIKQEAQFEGTAVEEVSESLYVKLK